MMPKKRIKLIIELLLVNLLFSSVNAQTTSVPFKLGYNYFIKNTVIKKSLANPIIKDSLSFTTIFGMATLMGPQGKPTSINFNNQFVIAIFQKATNHYINYKNVKLVQLNPRKLRLTYEATRGAELSYSVRPYLLLIVDKKYLGDLKVSVKP